MRILQYRGLDVTPAVRALFEGTLAQLAAGNFRAADVRKLQGRGLYRARLNHSDRLIFRYVSWQNQTCLLLLEIVYNHDYSRSRFLRGAVVDESRITPVDTPPTAGSAEVEKLVYLHPENRYIHFLDRVLSLDDRQAEAYSMRPPAILVGSAGSGKTVLTLERMKDLTGDVLYVTLSPFLAENARSLYYAAHYENESQEVEFLSFRELVESIRLPQGKPLSARDFETWFSRHRSASTIKDGHRLHEEFGGVLGGSLPDRPCLTRDEYLALGIRQSVFLPEERDPVYDLFERYQRMLRDEGRYDLNQAAFDCLPLVRPRYDVAVVDEVQDITILQLQVILKSLRSPHQFILCGDSNQIVHPNFFSWSKVKSFFYHREAERHTEIMQVLDANYRNSLRVTEIANRLLRLKTARFGSVDRESNYLVRCCSERQGTVELLADSPEAKRDLNQKTRRSARFAVLVLRPEDKADAQRTFETPLVFSVQEAKGLEYPDVLLYNLVSANARPFADTAEGMTAEQTEGELRYARARDKTDKSLEVYKFFVNSLYVAMTRAVENLYILEANQRHPLLTLLGLGEVRQRATVRAQESSREEWQREARRLELQGKTEQADAIRRKVLGTQPVPWPVITPESLPALMAEALDEQHYNRKAKDLLFEYAVIHSTESVLPELVRLKYNRAADPVGQSQAVEERYTREYKGKRFDELYQKINRHGVNFRDPMNQTPLMLAAQVGNPELVRRLLTDGADPELRDNWGRTALQVAMLRAIMGLGGARAHLGELYELLAPGSIRVRIHRRLVKIDRHQAEFLLLNTMLALLQDTVTTADTWQRPTFSADDIMEQFALFPDYAVPPWRKKRPYINALLARNEIGRLDPGNRDLLVRIHRGGYILNPLMQIEVGESWVGVYELANLKALAARSGNPMAVAFAHYVETVRDKLRDLLDRRSLGVPEADLPRPPAEDDDESDDGPLDEELAPPPAKGPASSKPGTTAGALRQLDLPLP